MKKKLTNFGVYIVKKVFSPVYDKIYGKGWDDARRMWDAAQDYPVVGPEEPDTYDSLYDVDDDEDYALPFDYDYGYGGSDTRAEFYKWRAEKPYSEGEEFINEWMATDIDHNVWIGDISLAVPSRLTSGTWEIYSRNLLFEDCERYTDKFSALLRIYWLQNVWTKEVKA